MLTADNMQCVVDLQHSPYKTASDTLASRFVASDNLDVTWTLLDCPANQLFAPYMVLKLTPGHVIVGGRVDRLIDRTVGRTFHGCKRG